MMMKYHHKSFMRIVTIKVPLSASSKRQIMIFLVSIQIFRGNHMEIGRKTLKNLLHLKSLLKEAFYKSNSNNNQIMKLIMTHLIFVQIEHSKSTISTIKKSEKVLN